MNDSPGADSAGSNAPREVAPQAGSTAVSGAGREGASCEIPDSRYEPTYTELSGTCGVVMGAHWVNIDNSIVIEKFANLDIETETEIEGCTVRIVQIVKDKTGVQQSRIEGSLTLEGDDTLSGEVTITRFDPEGAETCTGAYAATLSRDITTLGGAAG